MSFFLSFKRFFRIFLVHLLEALNIYSLMEAIEGGRSLTKKAFNGFFAMIGLCLSLISPQALANHPTLLSNCNSFKLDSGDFVRRVDALVGKIDNLVRTDSNVQQEVKAGKDITQNVYAAGLINKIQDCNEDATNPNIQVVGGDPLKNTTGKSARVIAGRRIKHV